jgi:hypothetical protein
MSCECLCAYDSWFVLNLIVILLHLLVSYNGRQKKKRELSNFGKWRRSRI